MIDRRKQRIVSIVVAATLVPAIVAFLIYLFATGSPDAWPLLLNLVGLVAGAALVHLLDRALRACPSVRRWIRGIVLAVACVAGLALQSALPFDGTASEASLKGLGAGATLTAFLALFRVLLPPESSMRVGSS